MAGESKESKWTPARGDYIRKYIIIALAFGVSFFCACFYFFPFKLPPMETAGERIAFTLKWQVLSLLPLLKGVMDVAYRRRVSDASDPLYGNAEHLVQLHKNILQNTLEQYIIHFTSLLVMSCYLPSDWMKAIPIIVIIFLIGRFTFKTGYESDPMKRVFGMALTLLSSVASVGYCILCFLMSGGDLRL